MEINYSDCFERNSSTWFGRWSLEVWVLQDVRTTQYDASIFAQQSDCAHDICFPSHSSSGNLNSSLWEETTRREHETSRHFTKRTQQQEKPMKVSCDDTENKNVWSREYIVRKVGTILKEWGTPDVQDHPFELHRDMTIDDSMKSMEKYLHVIGRVKILDLFWNSNHINESRNTLFSRHEGQKVGTCPW